MAVVTVLTVAGEADVSNASYQAFSIGIGVSPPVATGLAIGAGNKFTVDANGNLTRINNVPYSWPASQGTAGQTVQNDGAGNLTWVTPAAGVSGTGAASQVTFWSGVSAVTGDAAFRWDNTNKRLALLNGSPPETFVVGATSQFRVNSTGNLVRVNDVPYSWPASQGTVDQFLRNDGSGNLTWATPAGGAVVGTYTCPIGVAVQDVVYVSGSGSVDRADANAVGQYPVIGVVISKPTGTSAVVQFAGEVSGFTGLTAGAVYWLDTAAGQISSTCPSSPGDAAQVVGVAKTSAVLTLKIGDVTFV